MRISADWLTAPASRAVCAALNDAGHEALFVGGCVRNALLGVPVSDLDIATDARPQQTIAALDAAGLKAIPTGLDHGTVTAVVDGKPFEITTFRKDVDTDGRHARVAFSHNLADDAQRRDFTMNALYARPDGEVLDPVGGLDDLQARRLRFIGSPDARIAEDYLRILRFFRFHAFYADPALGMDADALAACAAGLDGLDRVSAERIGQEMRKLLTAREPSQSVAAMEQTGVLLRILPGAAAKALPVLVHLEQQVHASPDAMRRLASLGGEGAAEKLRLSKAEQKSLALLRNGVAAPDSAVVLAYRHGTKVALDIMLLRGALMEMPLPDDVAARIDHGASAKFPVAAADLMPDYTGAALGARLKDLESRWIASDFSLSRADLLGDHDDD
ncbi:CCA tRNA nucleotidyltransferase [Qingshengfaniella alkalisoli]|uniref:CCA tRNA nucleotidyltransferase n=1 Tax=Qingshengfaniella alkalisoli TaxID=2599296 RepID=A0A5B8IDG3_9RHOB|nr:CCA tRNA nucleotidyltransferase [Qingshengfaniella alkalisoli]QDY71716.1 CCA tRNA nucleotidyltransferase [Qingshengfaniella alkalisoli]